MTVKRAFVVYCQDCQATKTTEDVAIACPMCRQTMEQVGWFEYDEEEYSPCLTS